MTKSYFDFTVNGHNIMDMYLIKARAVDLLDPNSIWSKFLTSCQDAIKANPYVSNTVVINQELEKYGGVLIGSHHGQRIAFADREKYAEFLLKW